MTIRSFLPLLLCTLVAAADPPAGKPEARKSKDTRTTFALPVQGQLEKYAPELIAALQALDAIDEAELDAAGKTITVVLTPEAELTLSALTGAMRPLKSDLDLDRLKLNHPCTVLLKGELDGTKPADARYTSRHPARNYKNMPGQRLLEDLKAVEGVRSVTYPDARSIKLGMDRDVSFRTVERLISDRGSKSDGSAYIADLVWKGDKQLAPPERPGRSEKGAGKTPAEPTKDPGLR